ncbi:MAG: hypothetical protein RLZ68_2540, partial [Pseudomonadota bacterium]
ESLHEAIFQPYARSDHSDQRGAGLGLALCRAIAQVHGATMAVKARQGGGNSFNFYLALNPVQPAMGLEGATGEAVQGEAP